MLLCSIGMLSGCRLPTNATNTSVTVDENGALTEVIVEDRGEKDYTEEELQAYINDAIALYNAADEDPKITLESGRVENGSVRLTLKYASCEDYAAFNQVTCFLGTLKEAEDAGYTLDRSWLEPNGKEGDLDVIRERLKEWKVFIISEPIKVKVPDKILYASDNVKVTGRLSATVETVLNEGNVGEDGKSILHPLSTVAERFAYIIYK